MHDHRLLKMQPVRAAPAARPRVLYSPTNLLFPRQTRPSSQLLIQHEFGKNFRIQRLRNCAAKHSNHALLVLSRDEGLKELPAALKSPPPSNLKSDLKHVVSKDNASEGKYKGGLSTLTLPLGDREVRFSILSCHKLGHACSLKTSPHHNMSNLVFSSTAVHLSSIS